MMRSMATLMILTFLGLASVLGTDVALGQEALACESEKAGGDLLEVTCPLDASGITQNFQFKVNFLGGHDDTMASMTATLDGLPLSCAEDSKTRLMGEEGAVSLHCRFSMAKDTGTRHLLKVRIEWSHAQYADFNFETI